MGSKEETGFIGINLVVNIKIVTGFEDDYDYKNDQEFLNVIYALKKILVIIDDIRI